MRRIIIKISGEGLTPEAGCGFDSQKVREVAEELKSVHDLGDVQMGVIVGAGNIWRGKHAKAFDMDRSSADYMGMLGTILNALALQNVLESLGCDTRVMTSLSIPEVAEPYIYRKALSHLEKNRIVIFGGGTGLPFFTTDSTAALRAAELKCDMLLMAKNGVDGVYDGDPKVKKLAKRFSHITYQEMIDKQLNVMDLTAVTLCYENDIEIVVFDMNKKGNIRKAVTNPEIGTRISKEEHKCQK